MKRERKEDYESLFLSYLKFIERVSRFLARDHGYQEEEAEDFRAHVLTMLIRDEYAVFRKFQGRCSLELYLKTVIRRLYIDYEIAQKGKWRSSVTARRMGPIAAQLEELLCRKRHSFEEAFQILCSLHGNDIDRESLQNIAQKLPKRWGKSTIQFVDLESQSHHEPRSDIPAPDLQIVDDTRLLNQIVREFLNRLTGSDRLILKMRFQDDFTFEEIAHFIKKKKMQVYSRLQKILSDLQDELKANNLRAMEIREILKVSEKSVDIDFAVPNEPQQK
jgi:RNA polymerase sigma factor (sigma-70 family)